MKSTHSIYFKSANNMEEINDNSVHLIVTSPPYPMIEMWDEIFSKMNSIIRQKLQKEKGVEAFELMHKELDKVWLEVTRIIAPGGIVCINIGDAVRTINKNFQLYPNHARIVSFFLDAGFNPLPEIIWRKPTNAPNKFMGSGMLPPGAYVTLEHEFILLFRKGGKREFRTELDKKNRLFSAYFWEERNQWFSDLWEIIGSNQLLKETASRERSAAYPFELAYRLINMFSVKNDTVVDPFLGTGTTTCAAMATGRNTIGYEIDLGFKEIINKRINQIIDFSNNYVRNRLKNHHRFVKERIAKNKSFKYNNKEYNFPVFTKQEEQMLFYKLIRVMNPSENCYEIFYERYE